MLIRITNTPRPYAWGSTTAIAELLGRPASGGPEAELWLGSHPGSPARVVEGARERDLAQWAAAHADGGQLPVLLKVLAAAAPLSLQAHPTAEQAREGFARENAAGIPVEAAHRNYKDPFPKPELIVALSASFRALCGFRAASESRADLESLGDHRLAPLLQRLTGDDDLCDVVAWLLAGGEEVAGVVAALSDWAVAVEGDERGLWLGSLRMLAQAYPGDPGIAISTLMHTVVLGPGEALYLPAGNIHAYLDGLGLELMAPSDNVLRGGLTAKHVDIDELLTVLDDRPLPAPRLPARLVAPGVALYAPEGAALALAVIDAPALDAGVDVVADAETIVLVLDGEVVLRASEGSIELARGDAALATVPVMVSGSGRAVLASSGLAITPVSRS